MIIAIDGYEANVGERVGIGRYAFEILQHLYLLFSKNSELRNQNSFRVYIPASPLSDMPKETAWWKYRVAKPKTLWTFFGLPQALATDRPTASVVFSPTHYVPRFVRTPRVMAIMDLSYKEYPSMFRRQDLHKLTNWTAYAAAHAKIILTISEYSKNAIIKAYGVPRDRVVVTYPGLSMTKNRQPKTENVLKKYQLSQRYILSVGTIQPRKNYVRLIEAFSRIAPAHFELELIIVGKKGWLYNETFEAPKKFAVADRVKFLDFVPESDLADLFEAAICLALPSLYEGFGLPVLEAMAHTCPVVVSSTSSLPEIAGEAGIYVNPENVESIAKGIEQALSEHGTQKESERVKKGLAHIKKFSWGLAAKQTLDVLTSVGEGKL